MKKLPLIASVVSVSSYLITAAPAQTDSLELLARDVNQFSRDIQKDLEDTSFGVFGNIGIKIACADLAAELEPIKFCLNALKDLDKDIGIVDDAKWESLAERWKTLKNTPEAKNHGNTPLTLIDDAEFTSEVVGAITRNCTTDPRPSNAEKVKCKNATLQIANVFANKWVEYVEQDFVHEYKDTAINNVKTECQDKLKPFYASLKGFKGDSTQKYKDGFNIAVGCYQKMISEGEDNLQLSYQPTALNTALNHTLCMNGSPECKR